MFHVRLTTDPITLRALFDNETELLGTFCSIIEAEEALGTLIQYCSFSRS